MLSNMPPFTGNCTKSHFNYQINIAPAKYAIGYILTVNLYVV